MNRLQRLIMAVLQRDGDMTGYQLFKTIPSSSHQQVYREIDRLVKQGYLRKAVVVQAGKPNAQLLTVIKPVAISFEPSDFKLLEGTARAVTEGKYEEYIKHMTMAEKLFFSKE